MRDNFVVIPHRPRLDNIRTLRDTETGRVVHALQGMARALGHFAPNDGVKLLAVADLVQALGDGNQDAALSAVKHLKMLVGDLEA